MCLPKILFATNWPITHAQFLFGMKGHSHPVALLKGFPKQMIPLPSFSRPSANLSSASPIWPRHFCFQYFFFQSHSSIKKIFIWLCMSSPAWQIKAILSKFIYGSCSSLSFPLNPLCSTPVNTLTILLHFYVFYSSSCAVVPSLSLPKCAWVWWSASKWISEIELKCHLFD